MTTDSELEAIQHRAIKRAQLDSQIERLKEDMDSLQRTSPAWSTKRDEALSLHNQLVSLSHDALYRQDIHTLLAENERLQAAHADALARAQVAEAAKGVRGEVSPGAIRACYSIVCDNCRYWITSYRSSSIFVAEDLELAGWHNDGERGWICPECAALLAASAIPPTDDAADAAAGEG